jgi:hypothetical protein
MLTQDVATVVAAVAALSIPTAQAQVDRPVAPPALSQPLNPGTLSALEPMSAQRRQ